MIIQVPLWIAQHLTMVFIIIAVASFGMGAYLWARCRSLGEVYAALIIFIPYGGLMLWLAVVFAQYQFDYLSLLPSIQIPEISFEVGA